MQSNVGSEASRMSEYFCEFLELDVQSRKLFLQKFETVCSSAVGVGSPRETTNFFIAEINIRVIFNVFTK